MIGFILGTLFGIAIMCCMNASHNEDDIAFWIEMYDSVNEDYKSLERDYFSLSERYNKLKERGDSNAGEQRD